MKTEVTSPEVPAGCSKLVAALDEAVVGDDHRAITLRVEQALCRLISAGDVCLPDALCQPAGDSYARRLIHDNSERGYTAVAMVWDIGQGTPLHDHNGLWCVEGVIAGRIEIAQYDLVAQDGVRYRFEQQPSMTAGVGSAGRLIPPYDYHTIRNADPDRCAITIHVYGGEMDRCSTFSPLADGWFQRETRELRYTAA